MKTTYVMRSQRDYPLEAAQDEVYLKIEHEDGQLIDVSKVKNEDVNMLQFYDGKQIEKKQKRKCRKVKLSFKNNKVRYSEDEKKTII